MSTLLEVEGLSKSYRNWLSGKAGVFHAVSDVSFSVKRGETYAIVGESGAGKSTVGRMVLRLIEADSGSIVYKGVDVRALRPRELRKARVGMQMVFQDPYSSLDPKFTIAQSVSEPLRALTSLSRADREQKVRHLLSRVGLGNDYLDRFPHEMSGGQLQRVAIARAISTDPGLVVCDEPVAALDMSIRAQVLNLLKELQQEHGISYIFISHDISLVSVLAHRILVMRGGQVIEEGSSDKMFRNPSHKYTRELLQSVPSNDPRHRRVLKEKDRIAEPSMVAASTGRGRDANRR